MKSRDKSTMFLPLHWMVSLLLSVTLAMMVASMFSWRQYSKNWSTSFGSTTTLIRSCDSLIANSVPFKPLYLVFTASKLMSSPSANSPMATLTPPAPKSLDFLINRVTSGLRNRCWILRSSGALPFCTSAAHTSNEASVCSLDEPVAPPIPSRPVRPPNMMMMSPGWGCSRLTPSAGTAPTTAPISRRLAL